MARFDLRVEDTRTVLDRRYRSGKVDEHCALFGWQGMILVCAIADRLMDGEGLMWEVDQQGAASAATGWAPRK